MKNWKREEIMEIIRLKRIVQFRPALLSGSIVLVLLLVAVWSVTTVFAEQSISVSCYNLEKSGIPVGNVVVYDTSLAARSCNSLYYDCKGRCVGCFTDQDYLDSVCIDVNGTMFLN
jgi:hypothetical protein